MSARGTDPNLCVSELFSYIYSAELRVDNVSGSEPVGDIFELDRDVAGDIIS
jgi:hypothetical protein